MNTRIHLPVLIIIFTLIYSVQAQAQQKSDSLLNIVSELDSLYFAAHNHCDLKQIRSLLASDIETFHDIGGYVQGRGKFMEVMQQFCSNPKRMQRSLVPGTLEAYPMEGIGLLHKADHHFYRINDDGEKEIDGSGRMIMLWKQNKNNEWKVWDLISYGHGPPKK